jgi:long-chain acyl-CoA synthetase
MMGSHMSLYSAFRETASRYADKPALMFRPKGGEYESVTYGDLNATVIDLAAGLYHLGIRKGDRVAIFAYHGPEWVMADLAAARLGAVVVPLYHTLTSEAARHVLEASGSTLVFVENYRLLSRIDAVRGRLAALETAVVFDPAGIDDGAAVRPFREVLARGAEAVRSTGEPPWPPVAADDISTIIYTSGTTGDPRGVMLSHANILTTALAAIERFRIDHDDVFLSFLPVSHVFEKTCGFYAMLLAGVTIAYAQDISTITKDIQRIRPTIVIVVPRIIEGTFEAVERKLRRASRIKREILRRGTLVLARYAGLKRRGRPVPLKLHIRRLFYDRLVAARFRKMAGGRIRAIVSGGAPLDRRLGEIMLAMGLNVVEGYGLTEAAPLVSANSPVDNAVGTVGKPFEHLEVRIGQDDEILVRGPNVMMGYYGDPEATALAIDSEGWLHTGDMGRLDPRGNLVITGRLKEIIVTSHGKNIAPFPIECRITASRYIRQCMLCGDNEKSVTALVVPDRQAIEAYSREKGFGAGAYEDLLAAPALRDLIAAEIGRATQHLAAHEKVVRFALLAQPFTVDNGLLTPTLKLRRPRIAEHYRKEIDAMYRRQPV